jgi:CDI immunity proteins
MKEKALTFAILEIEAGQSYTPASGDKWPLEQWYDSVRQIPITQLSAGDLAKACRQNVWIEQVVPVAVEVLKNDPQAGELYDGELVVALKSISAAFWSAHRAVSGTLRGIIESGVAEFDEDVKKAAAELLVLLR